jgi:hypothetical protein
MAEPSEKLQAAAQAISTAVMVLKMEQPTFEAFLKECRDMENFGHIVNPTLYRNSERKAVSALIEPLFQSAVTFIAAYEDHIARAKSALAKAGAA